MLTRKVLSSQGFESREKNEMDAKNNCDKIPFSDS